MAETLPALPVDLSDLAARAAEFVRSSRSAATERAYRSDWADYTVAPDRRTVALRRRRRALGLTQEQAGRLSAWGRCERRCSRRCHASLDRPAAPRHTRRTAVRRVPQTIHAEAPRRCDPLLAEVQAT